MEPSIIYRCETCPKTLEKRMDYNRHRNSHDRPHKCGICDNAFGLKTDRDRHRTIHGLNRPKFMCPVARCRFKGASRKQYLLKHMEKNHWRTKDPTSQKAIRSFYQDTPNSIISHEENVFLELQEAASQGDHVRVKRLLSKNTNLLVKKSKGKIAGDLAVGKGHLIVLKMIVEYGVDVNINAHNPWLIQALRNGDSASAGFLIESGAMAMKHSDLQWDVSIMTAQLDLLKKTTEAMVDVNVNTTDSWLRQACRNRQLDIVELLITSYGRLVVEDSVAKEPDLELAQLESLWRIVKDGRNVPNSTPDPFLHQALRNEQFDTAKFLITHGADVDSKSSENQTAFEEAVLRGSLGAITLLHKSGANIYTGWRSQFDEIVRGSHVAGAASIIRLMCETGTPVDEASIEANNTRTITFSMDLSDDSDSGQVALARFMLHSGAEVRHSNGDITFSSVEEGVEPFVESLWHVVSNRRAMPRSQKEPATRTLSEIKYKGMYLQLLLEERKYPKGRYLWERILLEGRDFDGGKKGMIRLLREWGPISYERIPKLGEAGLVVLEPNEGAIIDGRTNYI